MGKKVERMEAQIEAGTTDISSRWDRGINVRPAATNTMPLPDLAKAV